MLGVCMAHFWKADILGYILCSYDYVDKKFVEQVIAYLAENTNFLSFELRKWPIAQLRSVGLRCGWSHWILRKILP